MALPSFFLIGAQKAGSTALYRAVQQHPQIFMSPVKEPIYFVPEELGPQYRVRSGRDYFALFQGSEGFQAIGEASTHYLHTAGSAERIWNNFPRARVVAVLRQPAERAYSAYLYNRYTAGYEPNPNFIEAMALDSARTPSVSYLEAGCYARHLTRYFEKFPRQQIRVYLYEDWRSQPHQVLKDLFEFLEVDTNFSPQLGLVNPTRIPRWTALERLSRRLRAVPGKPDWLARGSEKLWQWNLKVNRISPAPLDPHLRTLLTWAYREDILRLQDLLGRDLSHWLK